MCCGLNSPCLKQPELSAGLATSWLSALLDQQCHQGGTLAVWSFALFTGYRVSLHETPQKGRALGSGYNPAVSCRGLPEPSKSSLGLRLAAAEGAGGPGQDGAILGPSKLEPCVSLGRSPLQ